ncbi:hypothetical protein [Aeromonas sobria]|nr:hypothetical protein [Aeromonas sobria]
MSQEASKSGGAVGDLDACYKRTLLGKAIVAGEEVMTRRPHFVTRHYW